jgi:hypothetical protein
MMYNIFVIDSDGSFYLVDLPKKYKMDFIRKFGTEEVTTLSEYEEWLELLKIHNDIEKLNKL